MQIIVNKYVAMFVIFITLITYIYCLASYDVSDGKSVYVVNNSDDNGIGYMYFGIENKLYGQFNNDRDVYNLQPLLWDGVLSIISYVKSCDLSPDSSLCYVSDKNFTVHYDHEDIFIVNESEFESNYYFSPEVIVDEWRNTNSQFRLNELDKDHTNVGIGGVKSNGSYYIVILWR